MKQALRSGRWIWRAVVGYDNGGRGRPSLVQNHDAPTVRTMFEMYADGSSKRDLITYAQTCGLKGNTGRDLTKNTLDKMLRNRLYVGTVHSEKWQIEAPGDFEPIVPKAVFAKVQARLDGRARSDFPQPQLNHEDFSLRRFVRCAHCDTPLTGAYSKGSKGKMYGYYRCRHSKCRVNVPKRKLESLFYDRLAELQPSEPLIDALKETVINVWRERAADLTDQRSVIEAKIAQTKVKKDRLLEAYLDGTVDPKTYKRKSGELAWRECRLLLRLNQTRLDTLDVETVLDHATGLISDLAGSWSRLGAQRPRFQSLIFPDGLTFDGTSLNGESARVFELFNNSTLASPRGFEPRLLA